MDIPLPRQICRRPSAAQMRALLCELEVHPQLACGRTKGQGGRDALWQQISSQLNNLSGSSGCTKTPKQWQKFWSDKKSTVKKHVEARKAEGLSVSASAFNDIELRIINLVDTYKNQVDNEDGPSKSLLNEIESLEFMMSDSDVRDENPLMELPIEDDFMLEIKQEPQATKSEERQSDSRLKCIKRRRPLKRKLNTNVMLRRLFILEKRRMEHEQKTCETIQSIARCIKQQEIATQRLSRVLLQLIPHANSSRKTKAASPSDEQLIALLDELESRPYLAHAKLERKYIPAWSIIVEKLNSIDGCIKSRMEWMNYWSSKKRYVKRMLDAERIASENDGTDVNAKFNHIEHRIIAILETPVPEFSSSDSPCLEEEYLEYDSDVDDETVLSEIRSSSLMSVEKKFFKVKQDTSIMKPPVRGIHKIKTKKRTQPLTTEQMLHKLLRMEEKRVEIQKTLSTALEDIYNSMHRQEQATKELTRVLVKIYDR